MRLRNAFALCALGVLAMPALSARAQVDATVNVGYIDGALPRNTLRFRGDAGFDNRRSSRAEFFYAKPGVVGGPGPPLAESRVNFQEQTTYLEWAMLPAFSTFVEGGLRQLQPLFNSNDDGIGDMNVGFKWAFLDAEDLLGTFQVRTYVPTGIRSQGLGTGHVSLEPAFLANYRLNEFLVLSGELRYWVPIGGTDFSGDVVRYGIGVSVAEQGPSGLWLAPVLELVGWTVLGGKHLDVTSPTAFVVESATGVTIVNAKAGLRIGYEDLVDLYVGYGRALTGSPWYSDIVRVELRWFY